MVRMVSIQEASAHLAELLRTLAPGDQIVLTDGVQRLGRIVPEPATRARRQAGVCKGMLAILDDGGGRLSITSATTCLEVAARYS